MIQKDEERKIEVKTLRDTEGGNEAVGADIT